MYVIKCFKGSMARALTRAPATAFIVTGQCRQGGSVFKTNVSIAAATRLFLESHAKHVVLPFDMDANASAVFLLLQEDDTGACGGEELCNMYSHHVRMPCQYARIASSSCHRACSKCKVLRNGLPALLHSSCFSQNTLATWTPLWCSMWLAWDHVQQHEQSSGLKFSRVVYSRVDVLFESSMGHWTAYTEEWHSGHMYCHDFYWVLSRRAASCALGVYAVQMSCTPGHTCCNPHWKVSWWPWSYCTTPSISPQMPHLHAVQGDFLLETRRDGLRRCLGAPTFTVKQVHSLPRAQQRLADQAGRPFRGAKSGAKEPPPTPKFSNKTLSYR